MRRGTCREVGLLSGSADSAHGHTNCLLPVLASGLTWPGNASIDSYDVFLNASKDAGARSCWAAATQRHEWQTSTTLAYAALLSVHPCMHTQGHTVASASDE